MFDGIDFSDLRKAITDQTESFLAQCRKKAPDDTFYGLALCIDSNLTSLSCQAASEESLEHAGDRFFIDDWSFADKSAKRANAALTQVWEQFRASNPGGSEGSDKAQNEMRKRCLETLVNGLRDFRRIAGGGLVADFGLFVYEPDSANPDEAKQVAKFLNSPATYAAFADPDNGFPF